MSNKYAEIVTIAAELDIPQFLGRLAKGESEVPSSEFIRAVVEEYSLTFEDARDVLYEVMELQKVVLTNRYTLQPVDAG